MRIDFIPEFHAAISQLDKAKQLMIKKKTDQLGQANSAMGKPLVGSLKVWYRLRCGNGGRLRLIYFLKDKTCLLLTVGPRANYSVYKTAVQLVSDLGLNSPR